MSFLDSRLLDYSTDKLSLDYLTNVLGFDKESSKQLILEKRKGRQEDSG